MELFVWEPSSCVLFAVLARHCDVLRHSCAAHLAQHTLRRRLTDNSDILSADSSRHTDPAQSPKCVPFPHPSIVSPNWRVASCRGLLSATCYLVTVWGTGLPGCDPAAVPCPLRLRCPHGQCGRPFPGALTLGSETLVVVYRVVSVETSLCFHDRPERPHRMQESLSS